MVSYKVSQRFNEHKNHFTLLCSLAVVIPTCLLICVLSFKSQKSAIKQVDMLKQNVDIG